MIDTTYINAERTDKGLVLTLIDDNARQELEELKLQTADEFVSDDVMIEFFEGFIANTEWSWIAPEDCGALTSAPILGVWDSMNGEIEEAYGFMDYALRSPLEDLLNDGKAFFQKG